MSRDGNVHQRIIRYLGVVTSIPELAARFCINRQTLADRWKKLGFPEDIPETMLRRPVIGGAPLLGISFNGKEITMSALSQLTGLSQSTLYKKIRIHGRDLTSEHMEYDPGKQHHLSSSTSERCGRKRKDSSLFDIAPPPYNPNDRSEGWCERKYEFLRNVGTGR